MIVLGIDPGSLRTGWGVVERKGQTLRALALGVVRPSAGQPLERRLAAIHGELVGILQSYGPGCVAIETVFHGVNTRALVTLGQARGAVMAAAGARGVELLELSPAEIKKAVTGRGQATKDQVAHMVCVLLDPVSRERIAAGRAAGSGQDATDALAVAIAALHRLAHPLVAARLAAPAQPLPSRRRSPVKTFSQGLSGKGEEGFTRGDPRNLG